MNTELILFDNPVLVTDEKPQVGDWCVEYQKGDSIGQIQCIKNEYVLAPDIQRKIIAGIANLPMINFSYESYETLKDKYGFVAWDKELKHFLTSDSFGRYSNNERIAITLGFEFAKTLITKGFTEQDMITLKDKIESLEKDTWCKQNSDKYGSYVNAEKAWLTNLFTTLKEPKRIKVEIKTEELCCGLLQESNINKPLTSTCEFCSKRGNFQPKISSNQITIIKVF